MNGTITKDGIIIMFTDMTYDDRIMCYDPIDDIYSYILSYAEGVEFIQKLIWQDGCVFIPDNE
jgi:hypothetical protein